MTKGNGRKSRSKLQLGAEALTELKEGRSPGRPDWSDRRPLRFWQPFNDWWRSELERLGKRPNAQEIHGWYAVHAYELWKDDAPTLQETRIHAKCLRSLPLVRDYFRNYRAKKRSTGDRSGGMISGEDMDYKEEDDDMEGDPDDPEHFPDGHMADDLAGGDPNQGNMGDVNLGGYIGRDGSAAAAAAAAGLTQLANLRPTGGPGALALELLHPALPGLPSMLNPAAAGLWSTAAAVQHLEPIQPHDLLRSITLQQLQHAAAMQQQLALAAIAQNFALSRAAGVGMQALSHHAVAQQHTLIKAMESADAHAVGEHRRGCEVMTGEVVREAMTAADCQEHMDHPAAALGRGKRKRTERRLDNDSDSGMREVMDAHPGPSGRSAASPYARRMQQSPAGRQRRGPRGTASAAKQSTTKRQPAGASCAPEAAGGGDGDGDGAMGLASLHMLHLPPSLGLEPLARDVLMGLTREQLVERVLMLQAHLHLAAQRQQQHEVGTPALRDARALHPRGQPAQEGQAGPEQPPEQEQQPAPAECQAGSQGEWKLVCVSQGPKEQPLAMGLRQQQEPQPQPQQQQLQQRNGKGPKEQQQPAEAGAEAKCDGATPVWSGAAHAIVMKEQPGAVQESAAVAGRDYAGGAAGGGSSAGESAPSDGDSALPDLVALPKI